MNQNILFLFIIVGVLSQNYCPSLEGLTGEIITSNDDSYNSSKLDWNQAASPVFPCIIVFCQESEDVVNAVNWAIANEIEISVRSGRHSYEGFSIGNGIIIDVSRMKNYSINVENEEATFQPGFKLIEVTWILYQKGFMLPAGSCPTVGVSGLSLGGGWGFSSRKYGMTTDSILSAKVGLKYLHKQKNLFFKVDFKGNILEVNETSHPELLWALKGAGNANFGIVIEISFKIYPIDNRNVSFFLADFNATYSKDILMFWQQWSPFVDFNLSSQINIYRNLIAVNGLFWGNISDLQTLISPILSIAPYNSIQIFSMNYLESVLYLGGCPNISYCLEIVNNVPDPNKPTFFKAKSSYVKSLSEDGIDELLYFSQGPGFKNCCRGFTGLIIDSYGGKINEILSNQTAFSHRNMSYHIQYLTYWHRPEDEEPSKLWLRNFFNSMQPFLEPASYRLYPDIELTNWQTAYYGNNFPRLQEIKTLYDPFNYFHYKQSIPPL